jgi:hypothetical protein
MAHGPEGSCIYTTPNRLRKDIAGSVSVIAQRQQAKIRWNRISLASYAPTSENFHVSPCYAWICGVIYAICCSYNLCYFTLYSILGWFDVLFGINKNLRRL